MDELSERVRIVRTAVREIRILYAAEAEAMGRAARRRVLEKFTWSEAVRRCWTSMRNQTPAGTRT